MEKDFRKLIQEGDIVTTRNGLVYIKVGDALRRSEGFELLCNFEPNGDNINSFDYDIMSIHTPYSNRLDYRKGLLVWERPSIKVGDFVRVRDGVTKVLYSGGDTSDFILRTKPVFKVLAVDDEVSHFMVEGNYTFNKRQFEKVDLYENE